MIKKNLKIALAVGGLSFMASVAATAGNDSTTPADEAEHAYLQRDFAFVESPEIEAYLRQIAEKLLAIRPKKMEVPRIILYSNSAYYAMADSAHNILISTEALQRTQSEDELAALLGHELTHIILGHSAKKSLLGRFPISVETMGEIAATTDQAKAELQKQKSDLQNSKTAVTSLAQSGKAPAGKPGAATTTAPTKFAKESIKTSQNVSLFWSDLLMPTWNRDDEREADQVGYDMMRAAGYDPSAFHTFLQRQNDALLERSARMEQLRLSMIKKAQLRELPLSTNSEFAKQLYIASEELRKTASEKAINALFKSIAEAGKDYESPQARQALIQKHEATLPPLDDDKKARSPLFAQTLRQGPGGSLLSADRAALTAIAAMEAGDLKLAGETLALLLPKVSDTKSAKNPPVKGSDKGKKLATGAKTAVAATLSPTPLPSPHLNFAVGKFLLEQGKTNAAEGYTKAWMAYNHAPAKAFLWRAGFQADRTDFTAANTSLEEGSGRLASNVPFLPTQVTYAKQANDLKRAQDLTRTCKTEEEKRKSLWRKFMDVFREPPPTGLYAECLANLGSPLPDEDKPGLLDTLKTPFRKSTEAVEDIKTPVN